MCIAVAMIVSHNLIHMISFHILLNRVDIDRGNLRPVCGESCEKEIVPSDIFGAEERRACVNVCKSTLK